MAQEKYDIFISYSRKDGKIADKICSALEDAGVSCFIDREGISTGEDFVNKITHNIENSQFFLFLASKNAYEAKFTPKEVLFAIDYKPKESIIPYIIDGSPIDKKYKFLISDINYQTIEQCPIEPDLVDDILKRLGRKRVNVVDSTETTFPLTIREKFLLSLPDSEFKLKVKPSLTRLPPFVIVPKIGYKLKTSGEEIIPAIYDYAKNFREGYALVARSKYLGLQSKFGFIDKTGKEVIPLRFDFAYSFTNGKAKVRLNDEEFYIDKNGNRVEEQL